MGTIHFTAILLGIWLVLLVADAISRGQGGGDGDKWNK